MRRTLSFLLSILAIAATAQESGRAPLKVMSFNIRYGTAQDGANEWERRKELVFSTIRSFNPDILGIQEALRFQLDEIGEALPGYTEIGVGRDDGKEAGEYAAILVREDRLQVLETGTYWFSDTPEIPGSIGWGNRIPRICTWVRLFDTSDSTTFFVFNTHWDHESQQSREKSASLLLESISHFTDEGQPVIVTGDFNAGEKNPAFRLLVDDQRIRIRDTFRDRHPSADNVGTFNGFTGETTGDKIDAILVTTEWDIQKADILRADTGGRYPSDHFPVTATLVAH